MKFLNRRYLAVALSAIVLIMARVEASAQCDDITFNLALTPGSCPTACEFDARVANYNINGFQWLYSASWVKIDLLGNETPIVDSGPSDGISFSNIPLQEDGQIENGILKIVLSANTRLGVRIVRKDINNAIVCSSVLKTSDAVVLDTPPPAAPTLQANPKSICQLEEFINETVTFNVTAPAGYDFKWYEYGSSLQIGSSPDAKYNVNSSGTTLTLNMRYFLVPQDFITENEKLVKKFSVCTNGGGCTTATVILEPLPTIGALNTLTICSNAGVTQLTDGSPAGGTWSGFGIQNGNSFDPSITGVGQHTVRYTYTNPTTQCSNLRDRTIVVVAAPAPPVVDNRDVSYNRAISLSAYGAGDFERYRWYSSNQVLLGQGDTYVTEPIIAGTTFMVKIFNAQTQCESNATEQTVSVIYNNFNSIGEDVINVPGIQNLAAVESLSGSQRSTAVSYIDGLGRPMQSVQHQASPAGQDIVQPVVYDQFGRETLKYQPFTAQTNGWYKEGIIDYAAGGFTGAAQAFYAPGSTNKVADDTRPYAEVVYESSPLNRPEKTYGPGADWSAAGNNKFVLHRYLVNQHGTSAGEEKIISWKIDAAGMPVRQTAVPGAVETGSYYSTKQLAVKSTTDEQGNEVREYTNIEGQLILKKVQAVAGATDLNNTSQWAMTYYVYDDFGNERYVFQPELSKVIHQNDTYNPTTSDLNNWAFQKKYDGRQRLTEKRVPGADWAYLVYDKRDRLVMTQDGNQRNSTPKYWTFTKYDELNRPVLTGIKDTAVTVTQAAMQTVVDNFYNKSWTKFFESYVGNAAGNVHGYTNKSYPVVTSAATLDVNHYINVNYYDNYNFRSLWAGNYAYADEALLQAVNGVNYTQPTAEFLRVTGLATGTKVKVLDGGVRGGYVWLKSINYYDDKYRVVQIMADNYKGGTDRITNLLDFTGKVLKTKTTHLNQDITWKNVVNVSVVGSKLTNIAGSGWGNAGAASQQVLNANTDGWIETTVPETTTARMFGLTTNDAGQGYANINYGFLIANPLQVYELGSPKYTDPVVPKPGDKLRIARVGTQVKYYKNDQLLYTSATSSTTSLTADLSFNNGGATFISGISSFSAKENTVLRELEYDHAGRLLKTWHTYNGGQRVLLTSNEYNELGQLVDKKLHSTNGTDFKQSLDYEYNIRGWLTKMNDAQLSSSDGANFGKDLFGFELLYNKIESALGNAGFYNGNISAMKWSHNLGLGDVKANGYLYTYDAMNRLTDAAYKQATGTTPTWASLNGGAFGETGFDYDLNGNLKKLMRKGKDGSTIDDLTYDYGAGTSFHSNKLRKVTDAAIDNEGFTEFNASGDDYVYDSNGSLLWDRNKGGQELLKNGEFTTGSTDWTVTDTGSRLTFANDRVEIASGSASSTLQQNNLLKAWSDYIVIIDMERTSGTANLTLTAGGTAVTVSNTGLSTFDMRTTSTKDFVVTIPAAFVGRINSIQVKGLMTISYNFLNLTERVSRSSDQTINYIYDASGRKLCQMLSSNNAPVKKTDYAGEYFYENDTLKFINHEEGRVVIETNGTPTYQYHLKDHLDNVR
ncbi:MAG: DUF6443 domain-containing protein, partial [Bacteroidota bacterium]